MNSTSLETRHLSTSDLKTSLDLGTSRKEGGAKMPLGVKGNLQVSPVGWFERFYVDSEDPKEKLSLFARMWEDFDETMSLMEDPGHFVTQLKDYGRDYAQKTAYASPALEGGATIGSGLGALAGTGQIGTESGAMSQGSRGLARSVHEISRNRYFQSCKSRYL